MAIGRESAYLTTLLLGACGWGIVHVVDRVGDAPVVEYCVEWRARPGGGQEVELSLTNLSLETLLQDMEFNFVSRIGGGRFENAIVRGDPPAFQGEEAPETAGSGVTFAIARFHPGTRFVAMAEYSGEDEPEFRLHSASGGVLLRECSPFTWLIRHELGFIVGFSILSIGLALLLLSLHGGRVDNGQG